MSGVAKSHHDGSARAGRVAGAYRAATSNNAMRAYLNVVLLVTGTLLLFCVSSVSFLVLYYRYIPDVSASRVVHLQFGDGNPWGVADFGSMLVPEQAYDISLALHVPRTAANLGTGNFMVDMALYSPDAQMLSPVELLKIAVASDASNAPNASAAALVRSRRPAILTHVSPIVSVAHTLANLPWFVLGWKRESEKLDVPMFEGAEFARGWQNVPSRAQVVIEADEKMQFYDATVKIKARFRGLRRIMYNHRILSFFFFNSAFFTISTLSLFLAYMAFGSLFGSALPEEQRKLKEESDEEDDLRDPLSTAGLSDTPRQFPTRRGQPPLRYAQRDGEDVEIKREEDIEESTGIQPLAAEADDEDEDDVDEGGNSSWRDSGIGTGRESERQAIQRRRKSRSGET